MFDSFFPKKQKTKTRFPKEKLAGLNAERRIYGNLGFDDGMKGYHSSVLEPLPELIAPTGLAIFNKMRKNDPVVGGLLILLESIIKRMTWDVTGENAEFVKKMLEEMKTPIEEIFGEIASAFTFGYYVGEKVWQTKNGAIRLVDIEPRHQTSLVAINDENGLVCQQSTLGGSDIPYEKVLHVVMINENRSPFGISILRHIYKPYYYKLSIEAAEALSIDRDLGGLPVMKAPEGFDFNAADSGSVNYDPNVAATLEWAMALVSSVRRDQQSGVVIPNSWDFSITRGENRASVPTSEIIARYNTEMATGLLASFISLGAYASTNNANVAVHVDNFFGACDAYALSIALAFQKQVIEKICLYNRLEKAPKFTLIVKRNHVFKDIGAFVSSLVARGVIHKTPSIEKTLLDIANLPYNEEEIDESEEIDNNNKNTNTEGETDAERNQNINNTK